MARVLLAALLLATVARADSDVRCGAFCLYVALKAVDVPVANLADLERRLGAPGKSGYSLGQLQDAAQSYGATTLAVETSLDRLSWRERPFAVIAHLDGTHFVNLIQYDAGRIGIIDAPHTTQVSPEAFGRRWTGKALLIADRPLLPEEEVRQPVNWLRVLGWSILAVGAIGVLWRAVGRRTSRAAAVGLALCLSAGCADSLPEQVPGRLRLSPRDVDLGTIPLTLACSPFSDPGVMRVSEALLGKERLDEHEAQEAA